MTDREFKVNVRIEGTNLFGAYRYKGAIRPSVGDTIVVENLSGNLLEVFVTRVTPDFRQAIQAEAAILRHRSPTWEHMFVTAQPHAHVRFRRALERSSAEHHGWLRTRLASSRTFRSRTLSSLSISMPSEDRRSSSRPRGGGWFAT
jgi:hypothetical protein